MLLPGCRADHTPQCAENLTLKEYTLERDGTALWTGEMGSGQAIIAIHGGASPGLNHSYLRDGLDFLACDHRLIYYDQRLTGRSAPQCDSSGVTMQAWVEDLEALRQHSGADQVILLAHSWGGLIAMKYAATYPERLAGLILVNSLGADLTHNQQAMLTMQSRMTSQDRLKQEKIRNSEGFRQGKPESILEAFRFSFAPNVYDRSVLDSLDLYIPADRVIRNQQLARLYQDPEASMYNYHPQLANLTCPALIIHGEYDATPAAAAQAIANSIPGAELEIFPSCGHFAFLEQPEAFRQRVLAFLAE